MCSALLKTVQSFSSPRDLHFKRTVTGQHLRGRTKLTSKSSSWHIGWETSAARFPERCPCRRTPFSVFSCQVWEWISDSEQLESHSNEWQPAPDTGTLLVRPLPPLCRSVGHYTWELEQQSPARQSSWVHFSILVHFPSCHHNDHFSWISFLLLVSSPAVCSVLCQPRQFRSQARHLPQSSCTCSF